MKKILFAFILSTLRCTAINVHLDFSDSSTTDPIDLVLEGAREALPVVVEGVADCLSPDGPTITQEAAEIASQCIMDADSPGCKICRGVFGAIFGCVRKRKYS